MDQAQQFPVSWSPQFTPKIKSHGFTRWHSGKPAMPVLGQRPCSWGEEHIHTLHKPQTLDASGTGVPRHIVLGENCNVPISSGHGLTPTPILEVLLLPPSLGLPDIWLRLNCSVPVALHFVSIATEDLMGANSWLALPHNWNWCGLPFWSLGVRAWSCGGDCGCSFFFCVSFSWNIFPQLGLKGRVE